jgi:hypothetical protein
VVAGENEKAPDLNAEDEGKVLLVFEFPVGALKLSGVCGLLGSGWVKPEVGIEAEADVLLKKGLEVDPLVAVFPAGVVDTVGALEKKFGRLMDVDVAGAVTLSEDGAVTVIFGTWADSFAFLSTSAFSFTIRSFSARSFSARSLSSRSFSSLARSAAARSACSLSSFNLASRSSSFLRLASLIFVIACASSSCFSHLEKDLLAVRGLPFVLSGRPAGPLRTDKLALLVEAMRFTGI